MMTYNAWSLWGGLWVGMFIFWECWHLWNHSYQTPVKAAPKIDWPWIYKTELDIWGQTFDHLGVPPYRPKSTRPIVLPTGETVHRLDGSYPIASLEDLELAMLAMG